MTAINFQDKALVRFKKLFSAGHVEKLCTELFRKQLCQSKFKVNNKKTQQMEFYTVLAN